MAIAVKHRSALGITTDISDYVVSASELPIIDTTYDNQMVLPNCSLTVIDNAIVYTKKDLITLENSGSVFARLVIKNITSDTAANTRQLELADMLWLLSDITVWDLVYQGVGNDYDNAVIPYPSEDWDGVHPLRFCRSDNGSPYRSMFVTLTHVLKMCLVKTGIITDPSTIDISAYYDLVSPYAYVDVNGTRKAVKYDELCLNPYQLKVLGVTDFSAKRYESPSLISVFTWILQVLDAEYTHLGYKVFIRPRQTGAAIANDYRYKYQSKTYLSTFDYTHGSLYYVKTVGIADGMGWYVANYLLDDSRKLSESLYLPDNPPANVKPKEKVYSFLKHAVVHRRKYMGAGNAYQLEELNFNDWVLHESERLAYTWLYQFQTQLAAKFPADGIIETVATDLATALYVPRPLHRHVLSIVERISELEY